MPDHRAVVCVVACLLPGRMKRSLYRRLLHYEISDSARIGFSFITADHLSMSGGSSIGHFNVIRRCEAVRLDDHAAIGSLNWIGGHPKGDDGHYVDETDRHPILHLERHASITTRHLVDCTGGITIGKFATVAGFRSQLLTHSIELARNKQTASHITVGAYAFVSTSVVLLPGSAVPPYAILAAGSVLTKPFEERYCLYGGQPARKLKELPHDMLYFSREKGFVS